MFAIADKYVTLTHQPNGSHRQSALIRFGQKSAHEINGKTHERSCLFAYEFTVHHGGLNNFPVQDVNVPADVVAGGQRPELLADKFPES